MNRYGLNKSNKGVSLEFDDNSNQICGIPIKLNQDFIENYWQPEDDSHYPFRGLVDQLKNKQLL